MSLRWSIALAACAAAIFTASPAPAADVGVSVNIGQPGFYGRIDIGSFPPPPVLYPQPVVIAPAPVAVVQRPIYLRVPPGHARDWSRHCARYNACSQRTYFVQEDWYRTVYAPARGHRHEPHWHHGAPRHGYREHRHHDRHDDRHQGRRHDRHHDRHDGGPGRGHGHGKHKGRD